MKKTEKNRGIRDIYKVAKDKWKREGKQKAMEIYLKEELETELKEKPDRYFELKVYCNDLADREDICMMISVCGVLMGLVSEIETIYMLAWILLLSIVGIIAPIPYKKCKLVLDNMDKSDEICSNRSH